MVNLSEIAQRLSHDSSAWVSESVDRFNGNQVDVRVIRCIVANWHLHTETDEMFVVLSGSVTIDTENGSFKLNENDCMVVKAGTKHRARTDETATLMTLIGETM